MASTGGVELAQRVLDYVQDAHYPTHRRDLIEHARRKNAPEDVLRTLERIPEEIYDDLPDVKEGLRRSHVITREEAHAIRR